MVYNYISLYNKVLNWYLTKGGIWEGRIGSAVSLSQVVSIYCQRATAPDLLQTIYSVLTSYITPKRKALN